MPEVTEWMVWVAGLVGTIADTVRPFVRAIACVLFGLIGWLLIRILGRRLPALSTRRFSTLEFLSGVLLMAISLVPLSESDLIRAGLFGVGLTVLAESIANAFRHQRQAEEAEERERQQRLQHDADRAQDEHRIAELRAQNEKLLAAAEASENRHLIRSEIEARSAFALAFFATILPTKAVRNGATLIQEMCAAISSLSADLGIRFSDEERKILESPSADLAGARCISEMVLARVRELPQKLWCFAELGGHGPSLQAQAEGAHSTKASLDWLRSLRGNPFLQYAPSFTKAVDELIDAFGPYENTVPDAARESLKQRVSKALNPILNVYFQSRSTQTAYRRSPWRRINGVLSCDIDNPSDPERSWRLAVKDHNTYALSELQHNKIKCTASVGRDAAGWYCSVHPNNRVEDRCFDIRLVVAVTGGGNPPTDAEE